MITHTVLFKLKHAQGSAEEKAFLQKASALREIPNVTEFRVLQQVGKKNDFTHGLSMIFGSEAAYQAYNDHADHLHFVNTYWIPEVADFIEIDHIEFTV